MVSVKVQEDVSRRPHQRFSPVHLRMLLTEISVMGKFAFPIVFAQAGLMSLSVVDTLMLGRVGAVELAGSGVARSIFWLVAMFSMGMMAALDVIASQALGSGHHRDLNRILANGIKFSLWLSLFIVPVLILFSFVLPLFGYDRLVEKHAQTYLVTFAFGLPFIVLFTAMQRYAQSQRRTHAIVVIVVITNIINYVVSEVLIFGGLGIPAFGVLGAGCAATLSRAAMCLMVAIVTVKHVRAQNISVKFSLRSLVMIDRVFFKTMVRLGLPAGAYQAFESGAFSIITIFAAKLGSYETAAHQIVLIISSFTYTIPVGLANAAAFRVGHFVGIGDNLRARSAGNAAIIIAVMIMLCSACVLYFAPLTILSWFTLDPNVIAVAKDVIVFAAMFQVFDALQGCTVGALRGAGNTAYASVIGAVGFYGIALPLGLFLCFSMQLRVTGLWIGLVIGLFCIAVAAVYGWLTTTPERVLSSTISANVG